MRYRKLHDAAEGTRLPRESSYADPPQEFRWGRIRTSGLPVAAACSLAVAGCGNPDATESPPSDAERVELPAWGDATEAGPTP